MSRNLRPMTSEEKKELKREVEEAEKELAYQREIAKQKLGINSDNNENNNNNENSPPNSNQNQNQSIKYFKSLRNTALAAVKSNASSTLQKIMEKKNNNDKKKLINTNQNLTNSINKTIQKLKGIEKQKNKLTMDEENELAIILKEVRGELDSLPKPKATRGGKTKKGKKNKPKKSKTKKAK
jgi:hypothetical protein